ncbi:PD-(D/E)XK nuclease-like domain-containing protein [Mesorhizobium sp. M2A.F.Ca.ET.039.01.1.1]|uniref:PD-(D/E)XK nuclease-like domain-containing protein n=1 Tax=Mesorhizobium sp. M2A.F.Ca.ET.039.01.1.1 TaxID=2496746 RepID=UPI001FE1B5A9|nr:PD-(D/E)XK nuclease-like domain-containing protein [Mesorhizobium sp. M2A.F.Ca.ET.039.01.1.1]
MDEAIYRQDPALGSSDHKLLAQAPEAYWHGSHLNPARVSDKDTPARALGRGVHKAALEGSEAFKRSFVRRPDDLERLTEKVRAILAPRGETVLSGEHYDRAALAAGMIRAHPDLANSLTSGYPEVSVFWTVEIDGKPVRCKARFDYFKPRAIVDIKSIAIKRPLPFKVLCLRAIRSFRYGVQAETYLEARKLIPDMIRAGAVFGTDEPEPRWLDMVLAARDFAFVWVFWASDGPPLVWSGSVSPTNPLLDDARSFVEQARRNFVNFRDRFGTGAAWIEYEPLAEITPEDMEAAHSRHF